MSGGVEWSSSSGRRLRVNQMLEVAVDQTKIHHMSGHRVPPYLTNAHFHTKTGTCGRTWKPKACHVRCKQSRRLLFFLYFFLYSLHFSKVEKQEGKQKRIVSSQFFPAPRFRKQNMLEYWELCGFSVITLNRTETDTHTHTYAHQNMRLLTLTEWRHSETTKKSIYLS